MYRRVAYLIYHLERGALTKRMAPLTNHCIYYSSLDKNLPNPQFPTPLSRATSADTDILLEQIQKASSVSRIMELTSMHLDVMNGKHVVACLEMIHSLSSADKRSTTYLRDSPVFRDLCSRLMRSARRLEAQEVITSFKALSNLGVRNNTFVMQALLKCMGGLLNSMSLGQLTFLNFLLSRQKHSSLVDGLRLALPLVVQVQVEQQLDTDNVTQVVDCLQLACRARLKPVTVEKIIEAALQKASLLTPTTATTVIFALLSLASPVDGYRELIFVAFEKVSKNIDSLAQQKIFAILQLCRGQGFYHAPFLFAVARRITTEKWDLQSTYDAVECFKRMSFGPPEVMDHFTGVLCAEADSLRREPNYSPLRCAEFLSGTGYAPKLLEPALDAICGCTEKLSEMSRKSPHLLLKFLSCVAMMGRFPEELMKEKLEEDYLFDTWSYYRKLGRGYDFENIIFSLLWSLEAYEQTNSFHFPSAVKKQLVHAVCQKHQNIDYPLEKFLVNGLGGAQFLKSNLLTHNGIIIDHVLAMRSGNYPVSLHTAENPQSKEVSFLEDIQLPADARLITVIVAQNDQYYKDPEVLKGWMELKIKCLNKRNYSPVVVNYKSWSEMPDREKIPYLMQKIKLAAQEDNEIKSNILS